MLERLPIDSPAWATFVESASGALPFHHPAWAAMIARCYHFEAFALALSENGGGTRHVGGFPVIELRHPLTRRRRWVSLPFTDFCPPLVEPGQEQRLAVAIEASRREAGIVGINLGGVLPGTAPSVPLYVQHMLPLEADFDAVERRFRASTRRNVRAARVNGLGVRPGTTEGDLVDHFYRLQVMTRRRLGLPPQPRRFFRALWRDVVARGLGRVIFVEAGGVPVAAGIFLRWKGVVVYKYGASDPSAWGLRPNNLLFAHEIASACAAGDRMFHFGRTDIHDEGLRRFKLGWGADEDPLTSTSFGKTAPERVAPPEFVRTAIRRSPPLLARSIGELLYRYVA